MSRLPFPSPVRSLVLALSILLAGLGCDGCRKPSSAPHAPSKKPASPYHIVNAHEHIQSRKVAPKLLKVMDELGIEATVLCAGSKVTTVHAKKYGFEGYEENSQEVIEIAKLWPGRFIPFVTLKPGDADNDKKLEAWQQKGAKGLKLYTGHGTFYKLKELDPDKPGEYRETTYPLDHASMMPVYAWAEKNDFPVLWHVNTGKYLEEFKSVMDRFPNLPVICPHHCMAPSEPARVRELMARYPKLSIDLSHGYHKYMAQALQMVSRKRAEWRKIYDEFSDRLLWGTDTVITPKKQKTPAWTMRMARSYFGLFGDAEFELPHYATDFKLEKVEKLPGMKLPPELLRKIYQDNPHRLLKMGHTH